ncbi:MAG: pantetheine-phosphate adenylyltransferase [Oscillospiraceae bacterium]|nr:pantetheine-phosphate adenylyltransferase [Oscillospiraceae bacterium]
MRRAICPGSYDPVTVGHLDIIRRAAALFDEVVVLVAVNSSKKTMFTVQQRVQMLRAAVADIPGVCVESSDGLLAEYARSCGACALVKGVRSAQDLDYEQPMAHANRYLEPGLETVLLPAAPAVSWISSTIVREMLRYQQDISEMVPAGALEILSAQLQKENENR